MKKIKVLSLFDGISVAQQALKELGYDVEYYASEIDKYAIQITQKNHPMTIQIGDVKHIGIGDDISFFQDEKIDLLIGGSPCQDLSIAKKNREGLKGSRSSLFYEYVRILKEVKPKYFILENVNSMPKEAKEIITKELFGIEPVMINASLVSAQNRKRLFWVGKLVGDTYVRVYIPQPEDRGILLKDILEGNVDEKYIVKTKLSENWNSDKPMSEQSKKFRTLRLGGNNPMIRVSQIGNGGQGDRIYSPDGKSVNLSANGGGRGAKTGLYAVPVALRNRGKGKQPEYNGTDKANSMTTVQTDSMVCIVKEATKKGYAVATDGQSIDLSFPNSKTRRGRVGDKVKNLMTSQNIGVFTDSIIRKLTPIECERLQSLPDNYTEGVSNTQRYKALGNAFNKEVIKHILSFI